MFDDLGKIRNLTYKTTNKLFIAFLQIETKKNDM